MMEPSIRPPEDTKSPFSSADDTEVTQRVAPFLLYDVNPRGNPKENWRHIGMCVYLLLLTLGLVCLAYRDVSLRSELAACALQCSHASAAGDVMIGGREETLWEPGMEETTKNASSLSSGPRRARPPLRDLEEEIRLIQVQNMELNLRINNITLSPGMPEIRVERGAPGPPGMRGEKGDTGLPGQRGDEGPPGPQGPPGTAGLNGQDGVKGDRGAAGQKGDLGAPGVPGPSGVQGPAGRTGDKGDNGINGLPGMKGEVGEKGYEGIMGFPGYKGEQGSRGSEGLPGPQGPPGPAGANGKDGVKGDVGTSGSDGQKGDVGTSGRDGQKGDMGAAGTRGPPGVQGLPGEKGSKGDIGTRGIPGPAGPPAEMGQKGDTGANGDPGSEGQMGPPGPPGPKGEPGKEVRPYIYEDLVRIAGGGRSGRVQVKHNEQWKSICSTGWDINDGSVICRMLGYTRAVRATQSRQVFSPAWLSNVQCTGEEAHLLLCRNLVWKNSNCYSHAEVECV